MRRIAVAVAALAVAALTLAYVFVLRNGLAADARPGAVETAVARRLVALSIPRDARSRTNPHAGDPNAWKSGADHFADHCAICHGADGRGRTPFASTMYPPVPDLASDAVQQLSDGALFAIIQHGVRWTGMPAFASSHDEDDTWRLVSFLRQVPHLAAGDLRRAANGHDDARVGHADVTIAMDGTSFDPNAATVHVGDTVEWINKDPFPHNVASTDGGFRSGDLEPDRGWTFRATTAGTFRYACTLHPGMNGTLIVKP